MVDVQKLILNNQIDRIAINTLSDISLGSGHTKATDSSGYGSNLSKNDHGRTTCLIVNYLPQSVKEQQFRHMFSQIGRLRYCRLMFDRATGYSYGYGFVDYYRTEDAAKAIDALNQLKMEHKIIKVSYARPKCEETRGTNLYIRNLPEKYDENKLMDLFLPYGDIIQARVIRDQSTDSPRGIAFVIMGTRSQAQRAVESLNGQIIDHQRPLLVKFADDDKRRRQLMARYLPQIDNNIPSLSNTRDPSDILSTQMAQLNLLVNGNNSNTTQQQQQGQDMNLLMNTLLMMPFWSNMCGSTMPVAYPNNGLTTPQNKNIDPIIDTLATTNGTSNSSLTSGESLNNGTGQHSSVGSNDSSLISSNIIDTSTGGFVVFIYGIGPETTQEEVLNIFQGFGPIIRTDVIKNKRTTIGKGYGFVVFRHLNDALGSIKALHNMPYKGRYLQVRFRV
ncbi:unnamed protein product [Rotaria magnacalcarata]|uniref:RRM domain-containing protein n=7 Tax=Rotaria magnacalcarata TaxID=392030 RepID=A0A815H5V2_9BILA|nr:unnamed protein product [Rotaria magnacalcarata]CAF1633190.1 unnamed protein product [Rotaria magnacalcarata]CAF2079352.1 unnamed protein product [Rotaria magnacalcarata]CAF2113095.1 unnamed protein product [Rotaria magnacalcarata]CAF3971182.1 unnamed protein product [Rotaria magnacalcarata]